MEKNWICKRNIKDLTGPVFTGELMMDKKPQESNLSVSLADENISSIGNTAEMRLIQY